MPSNKTKNTKMSKSSILCTWSLKYPRNTGGCVQKTVINGRLESRRYKHLGVTAYYMVIEIKKIDEST